MISTVNRRIVAKIIDVVFVYTFFLAVSIYNDKYEMSDIIRTLAVLFFLFFNLCFEMIDSKNRTIGKLILGLELRFENVKVPIPLSLILRRIISFMEVYTLAGLFIIYLNKGKTLSDLATSSVVLYLDKNGT